MTVVPTNAPHTEDPVKVNPPSRVIQKVSFPKKVKLKSVKKAGKRKLKVTWKWSSNQDGYQVQYARNSKFTKKKKTVNVRWINHTKTLSKLASKKKYYVRVRAYKVYNGRKYYGSWSSTKKCRVK